MDIYIKYVNIFINDPKNSPLKLGQVSLILTVYASDVVHFQITNNFFSKIDLVKLTKRFQEKSIDSSYSISVLNALVPRIYSYLKGLDSIEIKDKLVIKSIIEEIDLNYYVEYINKKISEEWEWGNTSTSFEREKTMASVLRTISSYLLRLSSLTDDEQIQNSTKEKLSIFFSHIDFSLLGKLTEDRKKEIGPVVAVVNMLRQQISDKQIRKTAQKQFLSEIDFERLALSYNNKPIGNSGLANFCKKCSETKKELSANWKIFFETINFQIPFTLAYFNIEKYEELFKKNANNNALESFLNKGSDSICFIVSDTQKEELEEEIFNELLKHNKFNLANLELVCFKKKEYENFLEKFTFTKKLVPFLTKGSDSICINILHARKVNLDNEVFNEFLKHSGFSILDNTMLFQKIPHIFERSSPKLNEIFNQFDFKVIGLKAQDKTLKGVEQLLLRMNTLHIDKYKYQNFFKGLGKQECKRLFKNGCKNLLSTLKKCEFDEIEMKEWTYLEEKTNNPQTLIDMAEVITKSTKDYSKAEFLLKKAVNLCPSNSNARFRWIQTLIQIQNLDIALAESRKLVQLNESNSEYHNQLANILKKFEKWEEAEEEYRQSLKLSINNKTKTKYLNNIALLILENNEITRFDEAIVICEKAIKLNSRFKWTRETKEKLIKIKRENKE